MFGKRLLPLAAATLLAGCVTTSPYGYRGDDGDYYYGAPSVEYRYHGVYGDPYSYGPYRPGISVWGGYGSPYYGYPYTRSPYSGYPYYGNPYYGNPYYSNPYYGRHYRRPYTQPRPTPPPGPDAGTPPPGPEPGTTAAPRPRGGPWRNLDDLNHRGRPLNDPQVAVEPAPMPRPRVDMRPPTGEPGFTPPPMPQVERREAPMPGQMGRRGRPASASDE